MNRIRFDKYEVCHKKRLYTVLVSPVASPMWIYHEGDLCSVRRYSFDGDCRVYKCIKYSIAILAKYPDIVICFPAKKASTHPMTECDYDLLLYRKELQFRRSTWKKLKGKLNNSHYKGKYSFKYSRELMNRIYSRKERHLEEFHLNNDFFKEWLETDTLFCELNREGCIYIHHNIAAEMDDMTAVSFNMAILGSIAGDKIIHDHVQMLSENRQHDLERKLQIEKEFFGSRYDDMIFSETFSGLF